MKGFRIASLFALLLAAAPLFAKELDRPDGDVLLTVTGAIEITNSGDAAVFDIAMLEDMDPVTIETTTIWTEGVQTFTGVPLERLMNAVNATGETINVTAINDYAVAIPASDWREGGPIIAYLNNGKRMSVRDKGPLWIVWPFDSNPAYQTETIFSRSVWQLDRIVVTDD